jgi:hypothetical protein
LFNEGKEVDLLPWMDLAQQSHLYNNLFRFPGFLFESSKGSLVHIIYERDCAWNGGSSLAFKILKSNESIISIPWLEFPQMTEISSFSWVAKGHAIRLSILDLHEDIHVLGNWVCDENWVQQRQKLSVKCSKICIELKGNSVLGRISAE